VEKVWEI